MAKHKGVQVNSFYLRIIKPLNDLPAKVNSPNVKPFKKNLDEDWIDHPLSLINLGFNSLGKINVKIPIT